MEIGEFNDMFLPHQRMMFWAAWRSVGNRQEAEDIVQEALMKLWAQRDKLPPFHSTEAYCLTLVRNICNDRHSLHRPQNVSMKASESIRIEAENASISDEDIIERIHRSQMAEQIKTIIRGLPAQMRLIITLVDIDDRDYEEVVKLTGLSEGNVRVILSRARKAVRERFRK